MKASGRRILAVAGQAVMGAVRLRVVVASGLLLVVAVLALPFLVRHNGTAPMLAQVMLTYNLSVITGLLGLVTLWMACGALAGEIASGHLQWVAIKPVRRWEIWLGKWLGIVAINGVLLAGCLGAVVALLHLRARELPVVQREVLRDSVLVARRSVREPPPDLTADVEALVRRRLLQAEGDPLDPVGVRQQMQAFARARHETVAPNYRRIWTLAVGRVARPADERPWHLRVRFQAANLSRTATYPTVWIVGNPATGRYERLEKQLTAGVAHEFPIPATLAGAEGELRVECENRSDATLLFALEDSVEVLVPSGGFVPNLLAAGGIVLCWLSLLAAIGLAASSVFSFPTAILASLCLLYVGSSGATLGEIAEDGTVLGVDHDSPRDGPALVDRVAVPVFGVLRAGVDALVSFSPVADLGSGRAIGWDRLGAAVFRIVIVAGGLFAVAGMLALRRRQLGLPASAP